MLGTIFRIFLELLLGHYGYTQVGPLASGRNVTKEISTHISNKWLWRIGIDLLGGNVAVSYCMTCSTPRRVPTCHITANSAIRRLPEWKFWLTSPIRESGCFPTLDLGTQTNRNELDCMMWVSWVGDWKEWVLFGCKKHAGAAWCKVCLKERPSWN